MSLHGKTVAGLMMLDLTVCLVLVDVFWVFCVFIFLLVDLGPREALLDLPACLSSLTCI